MDWFPIPTLGGVNLFDDPRAIRDDEVQLAENLAPIVPGVLSKRGGLARPFPQNTSFFESGANASPAAAVICPISLSEQDMVIAIHGKNKINLAGYKFSGGILMVPTPYYIPRPWMFSWNGKVYSLPGPYASWTEINGLPTAPAQAPYYVFDSSVDDVFVTAAVPVVFQGAGNENVYPSVAVPYKSRLVLMNFGKSYENTIVFTDDYTADVIGSNVLAVNGRAINLVAAADGDEIVAGIEVMLTGVGDPAQSGLLILRKYGNPFLLTGDMSQSTAGTSSLDIKRISVNCGCAGPYTVAKTPVGILWAGIDDVWCFAAGVVPYRIGQKIQPALGKTPISLQYRWSAAYYKGFYRLAVFGEGAGMAVTDAPGDQWWLDLREGLPQDWRSARWWGPQQFLGGAAADVAPVPQTWGLVPESRAGKPPSLYYLDRGLVGGVQSAVVGEYGTDPRDLTSPVADIADQDYVDPEVVTKLVTKEYMLSPGRTQVNDGLMLTVRPNDDLALSLDVVADDDTAVTVTKTVPPQGFILGSSALGSANMGNKASAIAMYPQPRPTGLTHRFELSDVSGYVVHQYINDTLVLIISDDGGTGDHYQFIITIAPGVYTRTTLLLAIQTAINAAHNFGGDWTVTIPSSVVVFATSWSSNVTIGIAYIVATPDVGDTPTAAQVAACLKLAAMLGLATTGNSLLSSSDVAPSFGGVSAMFKKGVSAFEMFGLQAQMEVFPRTP